MMKRILSFLLCLIMVLGLAAPSVQASGSDDIYTTDDIMDNIVVEDGANVDIVMDGNTVNTTQETKLPNPADLLTEPADPPQIPMVTAPAVPVVPAPEVKDICECADLASAKAHGGICLAKTPYIELCKLSAQELFALWSSYTAVEQTFMLGYLDSTFPMKYIDLQKLLSAPTGTASETLTDGTTISVDGIPQNSSLTVDEAADEIKDIVDAHVAKQEEEAHPLFGYDVSVQDSQGADWQPDVNVKMELELPGEKLHKNTRVFVVHVNDIGEATTIEAEVTEDGKIVFETPGFSAFYGFTVDFEFEGVQFSINGMSSIKLSELIDQLKMTLNAEDVANVTFSNDEYIRIEKLDGDWELFSLQAFTSTETLTLTMNDGHVYEIIVTDATYAKVYCDIPYDGLGHTDYNWDNDGFGNYNGQITWYADTDGGGLDARGWYRTRQTEIRGPGTMIINIQGNGSSSTSESLYVDIFQLKITNGAEVEIRAGGQNYSSSNKRVCLRSSAHTVSGSEGYCMIWVDSGKLSILGRDASTNIDLVFGGRDDWFYPVRENIDTEYKYNKWPLIMLGSGATSLYVQYAEFMHASTGAIGSYRDQLPTTNSLSISLKNCLFHKSVFNTTGQTGGAVQMKTTGAGSTFSATNCTFNGNYATYRGGAISIDNDITSVLLSGCRFTLTKSTNHAGALAIGKDEDVAVNVGSVSISGCLFDRCTATGRGGAIRMYAANSPSFTIKNTPFYQCTTSGSNGGAISLQGTVGNVSITGTKSGTTYSTYFAYCSSVYRGGALDVSCLSVGNIIMTNLSFLGNSAGTLGGAVHYGKDEAKAPITAGTATITGCDFRDNTANDVGGGLCLTDGTYQGITVTGCLFDNCKTTGFGGGLGLKTANANAPFVVQGNISIVGCTFKNCLAGKLAPNAYLNPYTQEGVEQMDHDGDPDTPTVDRLNGASGAGGVIIGGTVNGKVEIKGTSNTSRALFENCLTWNNGGAICFVDGLEVAGAINPTTGKKETVILQYLNINKCFARDAGGAIQMGAVIIPQFDMTYCDVTNCGYFDDNDPNFNDPNTTTDAAALIEFTDKWFATQKIYDVTYDANGEPLRDANGNVVRTENKDKTAANKTACLTRWKAYARNILFRGADYSGTFRTVGNTACVANIANCKFEGNRSYSNGGGIYWNANRLVYENEETHTNPKFTTALTLSNTPLTNNYAGMDGGGIFCEGTVTIESCDISGNTAVRRGGGIAQNVYTNTGRQLGESGDSENTTLILKAATGGKPVHVFNNTAQDGGGISISVEKTDSYPHTIKAGTPEDEKNDPANWDFLTNFTYKVEFQLGGTHVYSNDATGNGGGIYYNTEYYKGRTDTDDGVSWDERQRQMDSFEKNILIDDGLIYSNNAGFGATQANGRSGNGGGVYMNSNQVNTADTIPTGQKTGYSTVNITGGSVYDNHAVIGNGGGIFLRGKNAVCTITGGVIGATANKVTVNGVVTMTPNVSKPNTAKGYMNGTATVGGNGGGIAVFGGVRLEMAGGYIVNNSCDVAGGGIAVHEESSMLFTDGTVRDNSANMGGGISLNGAKPLDASSTDDAKKFAMFLDGGIIQGNKVIPITYTTNVYGGGVCLSNKSTMKISDGEINENIASKNLNGDTFEANDEGGGIAVCQESVLEISGGVIKNNKAYDGGGIVVRGGSSTTMTGELSINSTTDAVNVANSKGIVMENEAARRGGGIMVIGGSSSFTMNNGYIYGNHAYDTTGDTVGGGGVCIEYGDFTLNNGRLDGNTTGRYGGGIYGYMADIIINNCVMKSNTAGRHGGAVGNRYGDTTIQTGRFQGNTATESGGAIYHRGAASYMTDFKISGGDFKNNTAGTYGGAFSAMICNKVTIEGGNFEGNTATANQGGGAYFADVKDVNITTGCTFKNNTAKVDGGAIAADSCTSVTIDGGDFTGNTATTASGGGAYFYKVSDLDITTGCTFQSNHADSSSGGALYMNAVGDAEISGGNFTQNTAKYAGGLYAYGGTKLVVSGGTFEGNNASVDGGGLKIDSVPDFQLSNGTFQDNRAKGGSGGGMMMQSVPMATISGGTFHQNAGMFGGGLFIHKCPQVNFTGGEFTENESNQGAGLFIRTSTVDITDILIDSNTVHSNSSKYNNYNDRKGGGLYIDAGYGSSVVTIGGGTFSNNSAPYGGGIWLQNMNSNVDQPISLTITGGIVKNNSASVDGGGIFVHGGGVGTDEKHTSLVMKGGTIYQNKASSGNGGGIYAAGRARVTIETGTVNNKITHGEIDHNTAKNGGGVYVTSGARLAVIGGYITYNKAVQPSGSKNLKTGYQKNGELYGTGGGICVTTGSAGALSTFSLSAPTGSNDMAIYGNTATFSADDVFSNGNYTQLNVPKVKNMNLVGYGFSPEGWFEDYNTSDESYGATIDGKVIGLNMLVKNGTDTDDTPIMRYRNAKPFQRRYMHINPEHKDGKNYVEGANGATYEYVNKLNAYVAMTLGIPAAADDAVVYDYGGLITINVWENDLFMRETDFGSESSNVIGKMPGTVSVKDGVYYTTAKPTGDMLHWLHGNDYGGRVTDKLNGKITFQPQRILLTKATKFVYWVQHNNICYYATVNLIPATSLYFEDSIKDKEGAKLIDYHTNSDVGTYIDEEGDTVPYDRLATWKTDGDISIENQDQDRPGDEGLDTLDKNNVYGYDSNYYTVKDYSGGQVHYIDVSRHDSVDTNWDGKCDVEGCGRKVRHLWKDTNSDGKCDVCKFSGAKHHCTDSNGDGKCEVAGCKVNHPTCVDTTVKDGLCDLCGRYMGTHTINGRLTFTFAGTGCDIISLTNASTGIVMANVYDILEGNQGVNINLDNPSEEDWKRLKATYMVDTYFGGATLPDGSELTSLRQVPILQIDMTKVMTKMDDPNTPDKDESEYANYGWSMYLVELYIAPSFVSIEHGYETSRFVLDAIRVYDPVGIGGSRSEVAANAYMADGEAWPVYTELRDLFIKQSEVGTTGTEGILFIDGQNDPTLATYTSWGPNNEVYLHAGQSIAFTVDTTNYAQNVATVQVGIRSLTGVGKFSVVSEAEGAGYTVPYFTNRKIGTSDMYFQIGSRKNRTDAKLNIAGHVVTISNTGDNPIAITNVKVTHWDEPVAATNARMMFKANKRTAEVALGILNAEQLSEPAVTPKYPALSFNGMICYNVFFSAEGIEQLKPENLGLAVFDSYDPEGTVETAKDVIMGATEVDGLFMVATNGVNAKYLGDTRYFRTFAKQADGSYVYSPMVSYSALDYAKNVLSKSNDVKLKQLVVAMLNYGAEAQKFFGYKTDDLMNKDLTADDQALLTGLDASSLNSVGTVDPAKVGAFASTGGFTRRSPAISFNGAFEINYFFTPANAPDGGMTLYFWNEDTYNSVTELTAENADKVADLKLVDGAYTAASDEIIARELDKTLYVAAVYESKGVTYCSGVLPYSIAAYCQKPPADVQALATAAGIYGCTAKQYFGE